MKKSNTIMGNIIHNSVDLSIMEVNRLIKENEVDAEIHNKSKVAENCKFSCRNYTNKPFETVLGELLNIKILDMRYIDNDTFRVIFNNRQ